MSKFDQVNMPKAKKPGNMLARQAIRANIVAKQQERTDVADQETFLRKVKKRSRDERASRARFALPEIEKIMESHPRGTPKRAAYKDLLIRQHLAALSQPAQTNLAKKYSISLLPTARTATHKMLLEGLGPPNRATLKKMIRLAGQSWATAKHPLSSGLPGAGEIMLAQNRDILHEVGHAVEQSGLTKKQRAAFGRDWGKLAAKVRQNQRHQKRRLRQDYQEARKEWSRTPRKTPEGRKLTGQLGRLRRQIRAASNLPYEMEKKEAFANLLKRLALGKGGGRHFPEAGKLLQSVAQRKITAIAALPLLAILAVAGLMGGDDEGGEPALA